jgi:hypothetical protein
MKKVAKLFFKRKKNNFYSYFRILSISISKIELKNFKKIGNVRI